MSTPLKRHDLHLDRAITYRYSEVLQYQGTIRGFMVWHESCECAVNIRLTSRVERGKTHPLDRPRTEIVSSDFLEDGWERGE
ncbi:hypothetical protein KS4_16000 [Poriferisphaera corsica]|uniref:Uncharacterized protein n=1 Tax=Poriferisphaera corsica TaxID=2528020 RepID=A0A517YTM1_9BACT|nr:hypothetical protein KS4_16000 [Poriferisphaera corsica]